MKLKIRGLELGHYRSVSRRLLSAAALWLLAMPGLPEQLDQYYVPKASPVILRFNALDPGRVPINEQWLLKELTAALQERSGSPLKSVGEATAELSGLRTRLDEDQSRIVFEYVHVARNRLGDEWGETLTIPVSYEIEKAYDLLYIRLTPAQMADFSSRRTPGLFFLPTPKLGPITALFSDFAAIIGGAGSLELHRSFLLKGTDETRTPPQTCIEKFDRLLGRYAYTKDEERVFDPKHDDVFLYRTAQESVPLKIAAVPYRDGSKVFYEALVPFELRADGSVKGYSLAPALKAEVHSILQDQPPVEAEGAPEGASTKRGAKW